MVAPFPTEIWLDIFGRLAMEREYDTLSRCRALCRDFRDISQRFLSWPVVLKNTEDVACIKVDEVQGWLGPLTVIVEGGKSEDGRWKPIPHLATFASRLSARWTHVRLLQIANATLRAQGPDGDAVFRDLSRTTWITQLWLHDITFPTILTFGRLICALPGLKLLYLQAIEIGKHPFDAQTFSDFRLLPSSKLEKLILYEHLPSNLGPRSVARPAFVELLEFVSAVSNRVPTPSIHDPPKLRPWGAVRTLELCDVTFPTVSTFTRLICALPALETLRCIGPCTFLKHSLGSKSVSKHPLLPSKFTAVYLDLDFSFRSEPRSVADFVDFFADTGASDRLRSITATLSPSFCMMRQSDVVLNALVRHVGQSLRHLSLNSASPYGVVEDETTVICSNPHGVYEHFDVSKNDHLEHVELSIEVNFENESHLCAPVLEVLSRITSTCMSRIDVVFSPYRTDSDGYDVNLAQLMVELPQMDAALSLPVFDSLTNVFISMDTLYEPPGDGVELAEELRLCLPKLNERGILGIALNGIRVGFYRDHETNGGDYLGSAKRKDDAVGNVTNEDVKPLNDHGTRAELCAKSDELVGNPSLS